MEITSVVEVSLSLVVGNHIFALLVISDGGDPWNQLRTQWKHGRSRKLSKSFKLSRRLDKFIETVEGDHNVDHHNDDNYGGDYGGEDNHDNAGQKGLQEGHVQEGESGIDHLDVIGASIENCAHWGGVEETHRSPQNVPDYGLEDWVGGIGGDMAQEKGIEDEKDDDCETEAGVDGDVYTTRLVEGVFGPLGDPPIGEHLQNNFYDDYQEKYQESDHSCILDVVPVHTKSYVACESLFFLHQTALILQRFFSLLVFSRSLTSWLIRLNIVAFASLGISLLC